MLRRKTHGVIPSRNKEPSPSNYGDQASLGRREERTEPFTKCVSHDYSQVSGFESATNEEKVRIKIRITDISYTAIMPENASASRREAGALGAGGGLGACLLRRALDSERPKGKASGAVNAAKSAVDGAPSLPLTTMVGWGTC